MTLAEAQAQLDAATQQVGTLEGQLSGAPDDQALKNQLASAKQQQSSSQTLVDALTQAEQSAAAAAEANARADEQSRTIERLTTTQGTRSKRQQDLAQSGDEPFSEEIKEIQELSQTDPGAASAKLASLWPQMRKHMSEEAVDSALRATKIYIDNRQAVDAVENDPAYQHLLPFKDSIRARATILNQQGKPVKEAMAQAIKEAQAMFDAGKKAGEPVIPPKPAPGAQGAGGGGAPPAPAHEPTLPAPSEELAALGADRKAKATGAIKR